MPRNLPAERRRAQVSEAWRNVALAAESIMATRKCTKDEAVAAVFADDALLERCHRVTPVSEIAVPEVKSPVEVQNR